ncbi:MAG: peptidase [Chitinophagales bacterium]|nr:peptidase [Chitinophagales bacterium]
MRKTSVKKEKLIVGRKDKADFPLLRIRNIDVKFDTGAYTSAIHCHYIKEVVKNGKKKIVFRILDPDHSKYHNKLFSASDYRQKVIKNSFGNSETRFVINTEIVIFGNRYPIDLSLSERGNMRNPVLIGRKFIIGKFVIDVSRSNISYREKMKAKKK